MSPVTKVSISLSPKVFKEIEVRSEGEEYSRSAVINRDLNRYYHIIESHKRYILDEMEMNLIKALVASMKDYRDMVLVDRIYVATIVSDAWRNGLLRGIDDDNDDFFDEILLDQFQALDEVIVTALVDFAAQYWIEAEDKGREDLTVEDFIKELKDARAVFPPKK